MYYSPSTNGFYDSPENYGENFPEDAVEISDETYSLVSRHRPPNKTVAPGKDGQPTLVDIPAPIFTRAQVERHRRLAYADPDTGSDGIFDAARNMRDMGEDGWEQKFQEAASRYNEIKEQFPWPAE